MREVLLGGSGAPGAHVRALIEHSFTACFWVTVCNYNLERPCRLWPVVARRGGKGGGEECWKRRRGVKSKIMGGASCSQGIGFILFVFSIPVTIPIREDSLRLGFLAPLQHAGGGMRNGK